MHTLDTRGLSCPQPVLLVNEAFAQQSQGTMQVLSDSDASRENIMRFAKNKGWQVEVEETSPGSYTLTLTK